MGRKVKCQAIWASGVTQYSPKKVWRAINKKMRPPKGQVLINGKGASASKSVLIPIHHGTQNGHPVCRWCEVQYYYREDVRGGVRRFVTCASIMSWPEEVQDILREAGIKWEREPDSAGVIKPRNGRVTWARIYKALYRHNCKLCHIFNEFVDCHHHNENILDDRASNLAALDKDEHARHHVAKGDVPQLLPYGVSQLRPCGFICYRTVAEDAYEAGQDFARYRSEMKAAGKSVNIPQGWQRSESDIMRQLLRYHRKLLRNLGL